VRRSNQDGRAISDKDKWNCSFVLLDIMELQVIPRSSSDRGEHDAESSDSAFVATIDPIEDPRWKELVESHPNSSIFHHPDWLKALRETYGFKISAIITAGSDKRFCNGLVFANVQSWITGNRLVSLPFSDHCDLLTSTPGTDRTLSRKLAALIGRGAQYAEIRSTNCSGTILEDAWRPCGHFLQHSISLGLPSDRLFLNFHKNCIQRKIRKAERESIRYTSGHSEVLLSQFYELLLRTRLRHRVPAQSFRWFKNLASCMGDRLTIHVASKGQVAVAAILTLSHRNTMIYKYGCSDERVSNLGGTPFLFWQVIQAAKYADMETLDLGRSDIENTGLIQFKERLGASPSPLTYWTFSRNTGTNSRKDSVVHLAQRLLSRLPMSAFHIPLSILAFTGGVIYRHLD
jgi:CelD/BcsL family acetyltransferase involved in cellulose biosynthesis